MSGGVCEWRRVCVNGGVCVSGGMCVFMPACSSPLQDSAPGLVYEVWAGHRLLLLSSGDSSDGGLPSCGLPHLPPSGPHAGQRPRHILQKSW